MSRSRPTIRDVAAEAGVSVATVSNVVNGHAHVRDATKRKVLDAIESLGYQASRAARSLPAGRSFLLAYCLPSNETPNAALDVFLHQMVQTASEADLEVLLFRQRADDPIEPYAELLRRGGADGFVLSGIDYGDPRVEFLRERNVPFACFGRVADPAVDWVDVDGAAGVAAAVDHAADTGHERIVFFGWPEGSQAGDERRRGYEERLTDLGLEVLPAVTSVGEFDLARKKAPELLETGATSVICVSDTLALGLMAGLRDLGVEPGRELAVTGFDDIPAASLTAPALTSVRQPMAAVGRQLVDRLVAQLTDQTRLDSTFIEPDLIVRQSTTEYSG